MIDIKKILFPTDFSPYADKAKTYAVELARRFDAEVVLLHVGALHFYPETYGIEVDYGAFNQQIEDASHKRLADMVEEIRASGVKAESAYVIGNPGVEIVTAAKEKDVDLIVMATHGHGVIRHLILGSVADRVVQHAPCPVLTTRHPEHEFVRE